MVWCFWRHHNRKDTSKRKLLNWWNCLMTQNQNTVSEFLLVKIRQLINVVSKTVSLIVSGTRSARRRLSLHRLLELWDFRASHPQQVSREAEVISDNKSHTRRPWIQLPPVRSELPASSVQDKLKDKTSLNRISGREGPTAVKCNFSSIHSTSDPPPALRSLTEHVCK